MRYRFSILTENEMNSIELARIFPNDERAVSHARFLLEQVDGVDVWQGDCKIASLRADTESSSGFPGLTRWGTKFRRALRP